MNIKTESIAEYINYIGIDPGIQGSICLLTEGNKLSFKFLPRNKNDNVIDAVNLYSLIKETIASNNRKLIFILEQQHAFPGQGVVSNSKIVSEYMVIKTVIEIAIYESRKWATTLVTVSAPKWQNKIYDPSWNKDLKKERSIMAYKKIFNDDNLEKVPKQGPRSSKPHLGCVDAALIAYYGKIITGGINNAKKSRN